MLRPTFAILALASLVGCSNATGTFNPVAHGDPSPEQLAAYAGHASYPTTQPAKNDVPVAAILSHDGKAVKVYNFSGEPIQSANIWLNGAYVIRVNGIAPHSSVEVRTHDIYNSLGQNFASTNGPVSKVQVQTDNGLYNTLGPASE